MRLPLVLALGTAGVCTLLVAWMRCTRIGTGFANDVANPYLVERGIAGSGPSELCTLEHIGRRTGARRLTPLHAIPTDGGFRFAVPLGERSEWARNVMAAGGARMQLHDEIHDLAEPVLLRPSEMPEIAPPLVWLTALAGWRYLVVRSTGAEPGSLTAV